MSGARDAVFAAIRQALGGLADTPPETIRREAERLLEAPETVRPRLAEGSARDLFVAAVPHLPPGASVERVADFAAVPAAVAARLLALGLGAAAKIQPTAALSALDWQAAGILPAPQVDDGVAVTLAERGVAETASLIVSSGRRSAILDAILPLHHIAVLRAGDIVLHLEDAFGTHDLEASRNVMVVSGPSGTTDIEGSLVIGVHGPATLHVIVVDAAS